MSKPLTSPANLQAKALASNAVMVSMPDFPATRLAQDSVDGVSDRSEATESGHDDAAFGHAGKPFWKR